MNKIKTKLISVFFGVIALMLVLNVVLLAMHFKILGDYRRISDNMILEYKVIETTNKLTQIQYVLSKAVSKELLQEYDQLHLEINEIFLHLDKNVTYRESRFMYRGLKNVILNIIKDCDNGLKNVLAGNFVKSLEIYAEIQRKNYFVKDNFASFILKELEYASILQGRYQKTHFWLLVSVIIFITFLTSGCFIFVFIFSKKLTNPLVKLSKLALDITGGALTVKVGKDLLEKKDEIGILAISFDNMLVKLKDRIDQEKNRVAEIKKQHSVLLEFSKKEFLDLDSALREIIEVVAGTINAERVSVWFFDKERSKITCSDFYTLSQNKHATGGEILAKDYPRYFASLGEKRIIQISDTDTNEEATEFKAYFNELGIVSLLDAAIRSVGKPIGVICHEQVGFKRVWTQEESEFVSSVADRISLIIAGLEHKRVEEALQVAYDQLKESQEEVVQTAKFKAIGQLASSVAHEVRNPLAIIMQSIDYLRNKVPVQLQEIIQVAANSVKRADTIIGTLMDFSKAKELSIAPGDINSLIDDALALTRYGNLQDKARVIKELCDNLPLVLVDRQKIVQVLVNLFLNAMQAMPGDGILWVRTYLAEFNKLPEKVKNDIQDHQALSAKNVVAIEIKDSGTGISKENMKNIFRPFFTTKGTSTGIGLGLSVVKDIVVLHNGYIGIESQEGAGTTVTVILRTV